MYGYWAGAALKNSFKRIEFARKKEIEEHRDRFALTRDRNDQIFGVWVEHFDAMALKTMIHRVCKLLPKSAEAQTAWQLDERAVHARILSSAQLSFTQRDRRVADRPGEIGVDLLSDRRRLKHAQHCLYCSCVQVCAAREVAGFVLPTWPKELPDRFKPQPIVLVERTQHRKLLRVMLLAA